MPPGSGPMVPAGCDPPSEFPDSHEELDNS